MRKLLLFVLFVPLLLSSFSAVAGDTLSLYNQLSKVNSAEQVSVMLEISNAQRISNPARAIYWANRALAQSQRLNIGELTGESYYTIGYLHYSANNFEPALANLKKAERISRLGLFKEF